MTLLIDGPFGRIGREQLIIQLSLTHHSSLIVEVLFVSRQKAPTYRFGNPYISPLRYPGGKRKLLPLIADLISRSGPVSLLVEPFAGGASVSVGLLEARLVEQIALSDRDELVAAFWKTVFSRRACALADRIANAPVDLQEWKRLKSSAPTTQFDRAYKCLFLNRTSFSGILKDRAGPIGGQKQESTYTIGCRYNRERLATRIVELGQLRDRVFFVKRQHYTSTFEQVERLCGSTVREGGLLWYLDPPFFEKAEHLYRHSFTETGHLALRQFLRNLRGRWVLSYDDVPQARKYYNQDPGFARVNLSYNARIDSQERLTASEIVVSNIIADLREQGCPHVPRMGEILPLRGFQALANDVNKADSSQKIAG